MMKYVLIIFLFSCTPGVLISQKNLTGTYFEKGEDFEYTLILKEDNTFTLKKEYVSFGQSLCEGKWIKNGKSDKHLILNCLKVEEPAETLSSRYMSKRDYVVKIISDGRIELEGIILRKVTR